MWKLINDFGKSCENRGRSVHSRGLLGDFTAPESRNQEKTTWGLPGGFLAIPPHSWVI